jgi:hypothetical protein
VKRGTKRGWLLWSLIPADGPLFVLCFHSRPPSDILVEPITSRNPRPTGK